MGIGIEGKLYNINGKKVRLYPIRKVCQCLEMAGAYRSIQTIRLWEKNGIIPATPFIAKFGRVYSREQIEAIVNTVVSCNIQQGLSLAESNFATKLTDAFSKATAMVYQREEDDE